MTDSPSQTLARAAKGYDRLVGPLLVASGALLVAGWLLPFMSVRTALFFYDEVSILGGTLNLVDGGQYFLGAVIFVFSIAFPAVKIAVAVALWFFADADGPALGRRLGWIDELGKWSMLDVFVMAIVVLAIQGSLVSDVALHGGIYAFTLAVILSMLLVRRIVMLARRRARSEG